MKYLGAAVVLVLLGFLAGIGWDHLQIPSTAASGTTAPVALASDSAPPTAHKATIAMPAPSRRIAVPTASKPAAVPVGRVQTGDDACPPSFEPPTTSAGVAALLWKYASCYARDDVKRKKDHFTPVADRYFEMDTRTSAWADVVEEKVREVEPLLSTLSIQEGSCHKDMCRYILKSHSQSDWTFEWSVATQEFVGPLQVRITGIGYNAAILQPLSRNIRSDATAPSEFKVYVFRSDIPADYLQSFTQLFELSDEQLDKKAG